MTVCNVLEIYPECLDGAQMYLHPTHGISIPQAYTSYIAPLSSTKLWNMAKIAFPTDNTGKVSHSILYCVSLYYLTVMYCDVPYYAQTMPMPYSPLLYADLWIRAWRPHMWSGCTTAT